MWVVNIPYALHMQKEHIFLSAHTTADHAEMIFSFIIYFILFYRLKKIIEH